MISTHWLWGPLAVLGALCLATIAVSEGGDAPAGPAAAAPEGEKSPPPPAESEDEARKHYAKGEAKYGDKWMPLSGLFEMYQKTRNEVKAAAEKGGGKDRLTEITKTLAQILADWRKEKTPVEAEKNKAESKKQVAQRVMATPPPAPPRLQPEPTYSGRSWSGATPSYDSWQREVARVRAENQRRQQEYQQNLARYNEYQRQARVGLDEATATIEKCKKKLDELLAARKTKEQPFLEERTKLNRDIRAAQPEAAALVVRVRSMEEALDDVPEGIRLARGIVAWQGDFYSLAEAEEIYKRLKTEVDEARRTAEAKARLDGRELPKDWRHPKQEEAVGLNGVIAQAKMAAAASAPR
jgi:hypothetical protein